MESFKPSSEIVAYLSIWLPESGARVLLKQKAKTKEQKNFEVSWKGNYWTTLPSLHCIVDGP